MVITRTPFRISLFGGGTDYPAWYRLHGGAVLATTIDKYCYVSCRALPPFFEHRTRIVYSKIENCRTLNEIQHPAAREVLRFLGIAQGVEIHHDGDLPARSGIGSSSAFTVGLLNALHRLKGHLASRAQLAKEGILVEQEILKETVGSQDQVCAAHGGFNQVIFQASGAISVCPVVLPSARREELINSLMLFYTGIQRTPDQVAPSHDPEEKQRELRILRDMVDASLALLRGRADLREFGELLHESWLVKRSLSTTVSRPEIDAFYASARAAGAVGGKITGAGGGGFLLLFVPRDRQARVREALHRLIHVPFSFDETGSKVIFCEPDRHFSQAETEPASRPVTFREREATQPAAAAERDHNRT